MNQAKPTYFMENAFTYLWGMRRRFLPLGFCIVVLGLTKVCPAQDLNDYVPVETRNERAIDVVFLKLDPRPWVLDKNKSTFTVGFSAASEYRYFYVNGVRKTFEDYENDIVMTRYRYGLGKGMDVTVDLPLISRGGGLLDPIVYDWHALFGLDNTNRNGMTFGQCVIDIPGSGPYHDAIGIGDLSVDLTKALTHQLMGTVAIKLPTGNAAQLLGSGAVDGAVDLQYKVPMWSRWVWQFQGGLVGQGTSTELKGTRGINPQAAIVLMHKANKHDYFVFQWQSEESGIVTGVGGADSPQRVLTFAYQKHLNNGNMYEVFITDDGDFVNTFHDPEVANIGPEPTIGVRYVVHL